ncbi:MAG: polysaccharide lyase family protein [Tepidisphaeraceae bacterium]|jgi:rhamnogalacturonan endolyase
MFRTTAKVGARIFCALLVLGFVSIVKAADSPVTLSQDDACYTLSNGIITAMVAKASGDLVSFKFNGAEMLATIEDANGKPDLAKDPPGENLNGLNRGMTDHQYGFWSHDAMGPKGTGDAVARITIDPSTNGGERAEVSVKGISKGRLMGTGPGARYADQGDFAANIEIRWTLDRGAAGVYTYCTFEHQPDYPTTSITEARFCVKLNSFFDWLCAGDKYNRLYPKSQEHGEDKYVYTNIQSKNPAFGWVSTTNNVGFFCINPSMEYMSGGPTKPEFLGHRDTNAVAAPCVLNYWRSSHYGGADVSVAAGEHWIKTVGPFMLWATSGKNPADIYASAVAQAAKQQKMWPFDWVNGVDYPHKDQRSTVSGHLILTDSQAPKAKLPHLEVGLTAAAYAVPYVPPAPTAGGINGRRGRGATRPANLDAPPAARPAFVMGNRQIDWQTDAKHYEFWTAGDEDGKFSIPNVRPGTYTLHAFADGVLGEYAQANVTVEEGKSLDLGKIVWTPERDGKQIWDVGIPNRNGSEFLGGDKYWDLNAPLTYTTLFPNDVHYVIGSSDYHKDWYFEQVPHNIDPDAKAVPFVGIRSGAVPGQFFSGQATIGNPTPFSISFDMPDAPHGLATLRLAICGGGPRELDVTVNGQPAGTVTRLVGDGVITRHQIAGIWYERKVQFDASLMKQGANDLTITVPKGPVDNGVIYDYLRLELDENGTAKASTN